jgi:regulator of RNase E activity RraA
VVIDADRLEDVATAAVERAERERELFRRLRDGATTVELLGLDPSLIRRPDRGG